MWRSLSDRPQEELAQFWLKATQESGPLGIYYLNMAISENRENLATLEFFFTKIIFMSCIALAFVFLSPSNQNSPQ